MTDIWVVVASVSYEFDVVGVYETEELARNQIVKISNNKDFKKRYDGVSAYSFVLNEDSEYASNEVEVGMDFDKEVSVPELASMVPLHAVLKKNSRVLIIDTQEYLKDTFGLIYATFEFVYDGFITKSTAKPWLIETENGSSIRGIEVRDGKPNSVMYGMKGCDADIIFINKGIELSEEDKMCLLASRASRKDCKLISYEGLING